MLPDLRIVIVAVISTFLFTAGVGFYTSSRFIIEPRKSDSLASLEDNPVNRIALNWPEPVQHARPMDLDFAVTLNGSRNPVRDVSNDIATTHAELNASPSGPTSTDSAAPSVPETDAAPAPEQPAEKASERDQTDEPSQPAEHKARNDAVTVPQPQDAPATPARELTPPTAGLALAVKGVEAIVVPALPIEDRTQTASLAPKPEASDDGVRIEAQRIEAPKSEPSPQAAQPAEHAAQKDESGFEIHVPETTGTVTLPTTNIPLPLAKPDPTSKSKQAAARRTKKPAKTAMRTTPARPAAPPAQKAGFPLNLFVSQSSSAKPNPAQPAATKPAPAAPRR